MKVASRISRVAISNNVTAPYKVLDVDYDGGGHVYDTRLSRPVLGVTYRFWTSGQAA
jgi:hypothetical protein